MYILVKLSQFVSIEITEATYIFVQGRHNKRYMHMNNIYLFAFESEETVLPLVFFPDILLCHSTGGVILVTIIISIALHTYALPYSLMQ